MNKRLNNLCRPPTTRWRQRPPQSRERRTMRTVRNIGTISTLPRRFRRTCGCTISRTSRNGRFVTGTAYRQSVFCLILYHATKLRDPFRSTSQSTGLQDTLTTRDPCGQQFFIFVTGTELRSLVIWKRTGKNSQSQKNLFFFIFKTSLCCFTSRGWHLLGGWWPIIFVTGTAERRRTCGCSVPRGRCWCYWTWQKSS